MFVCVYSGINVGFSVGVNVYPLTSERERRREEEARKELGKGDLQ